MDTHKRGPGRPRLPTPERRRNMLASKAKWRLENREYYLQQKRELSGRPEYLNRRRELRAQQRQKARGVWIYPTDGDRCILDYANYNASTFPIEAF